MHKYWANNEPLTDSEMRILGALCNAHSHCVFRENCSTMALQQAAFGSRDIVKSYIAALATIGEAHGPIVEAYRVLTDESECCVVAGFGNSFIKGSADPAFVKVHEFLKSDYPEIIDKIESIQARLLLDGKDLYPNPACYTAAAALALGMPAILAPSLFVQARMEAWSVLFWNVIKSTQKSKQDEPKEQVAV